MPDPAQEDAVKLTQLLYEQLTQAAATPIESGLFSIFKSHKKEKIVGLYFWGGVGRGKSFIIDSLFECLPFAEKKRMHFNRFMQDIHSQLRVLPKTPDPLVVIAENWRRQYKVIFIDEFHVDDISDAMIMAGLLKALFERGTVLLTTSNIAPDDLYKNGLQRERFLPAIELIKDNTNIYHLHDGTDYRLQNLQQEGTYHVVPPHESREIMESYASKLATAPIKRNDTINVNNRDIRFKVIAKGCIWFEFSDICQTPRSAADYIQLSERFYAIMISNIPFMGDGQNDVVQRFIHLIDAIYDHRVKFIATALTEPDELYTGERLAFSFQRTKSRLHEMRGDSYLTKKTGAD